MEILQALFNIITICVNYMRSRWKDASFLTDSLHGLPGQGNPINFAFLNHNCNNLTWERPYGYDLRALASTKIDTFYVGQTYHLDIVHTFSNSLCQSMQDIQEVIQFYNNHLTISDTHKVNTFNLQIYPNPVIENLVIQSDTQNDMEFIL